MVLLAVFCRIFRIFFEPMRVSIFDDAKTIETPFEFPGAPAERSNAPKVKPIKTSLVWLGWVRLGWFIHLAPGHTS